jgi:hypothetical protein
VWHVYGGKEKCIQGLGWEDLMETEHLEYLTVDGKIILKWIFQEVGWVGTA